MNNCLSGETISAMIDGTLPAPEGLLATRHMDTCADCSQLVADMRDIEAALRWEVDQVHLQARFSNIDQLVQGALARTKGTANSGIIMEYGKKHLLDVLSPICGERLTKQTMYLASKGKSESPAGPNPESEWKAFIHELSAILADLCGISVKNAVHQLSRQVLSGVA